MDPRLLSWAHAAASRCRSRQPVLWLFTDARRLPDPRPAAARLPRGLAGIVLRHDGDPARSALGRDLARICRARRLVLVVAGDVRLARALRAGVHLRAGRWPAPLRPGRGMVTSSAHGPARDGPRPPFRRRPRFPLAGVRHREPPRRARTGFAALEPDGGRRGTGRGCAGRHRRSGGAPPDAPILLRDWRDRGPGLRPLCQTGHSVSQLPSRGAEAYCDLRGVATILRH